MSNTLCCWLCRILSDLSVRLFAHCPPSHSCHLSISIILLPLFSPLSPSPSSSLTRVWIRSLLVTWAIWRETLSSNLSPLSLLIRTTSHMWHSVTDWLTYLPVDLKDSHTDSTHSMLLADWPSFNLGGVGHTAQFNRSTTAVLQHLDIPRF